MNSKAFVFSTPRRLLPAGDLLQPQRVTGWQGGGGLLNEDKSVHLPRMAVGGFFFVPLFFLSV